MTKPTSRKWTPVLSADGTIYCSPACGFRCTKAAHDKALRQARELAERLGPGWEPSVWENMGWHFSADKGVCSVHDHTRHNRVYTAFFNSAHQSVTSHPDPREAVRLACQEAMERARKVADDVAALAPTP